MTDAKEYGRALFLVTEEDGVTDTVAEDVKSARAVLLSNPNYIKLLDTPALPKEERVGLIDRAFSALDERLVNLLKILAEKHSAYLFIKAADVYLAMYDEARGIERVEAITAVPLSEGQKEKIAEKLKQLTGKTAVISNTVAPAILGGVKLRYGGAQLDGSVRTRLDKFEEALKKVVM